MRQRHDFYTLCPGCEAQIELTLAAKLQSARAGCSCSCNLCKHEWVCIQEWIYRHESLDLSQPVHFPQQHSAVSSQQAGGHVVPAANVPEPAVTPMQPPRPHLPTFQPPQPAGQPVQQNPVLQQPAVSSIDGPAPAEEQNRVPAPHAWSWERQAQLQSSSAQNQRPGYDR